MAQPGTDRGDLSQDLQQSLASAGWSWRAIHKVKASLCYSQSVSRPPRGAGEVLEGASFAGVGNNPALSLAGCRRQSWDWFVCMSTHFRLLRGK